MLNFEKLRQTDAVSEPFPHLVASDLLDKEQLKSVQDVFPNVPGPGSFPVESMRPERAFSDLLEDMRSEQLAGILQDKLSVPLVGFPTMITVRGFCRSSDGKIHADSAEKIATVLFYLNSEWQNQGGRLQLLNDPDSLDSSFTEVLPEGGTMLAFRCDRHAWHGHAPYSGPRRTLQLNWVRSRYWLQRERFRHSLSGTAKTIRRWLTPGKKGVAVPTP